MRIIVADYVIEVNTGLYKLLDNIFIYLQDRVGYIVWSNGIKNEVKLLIIFRVGCKVVKLERRHCQISITPSELVAIDAPNKAIRKREQLAKLDNKGVWTAL